MSKPLHMIAALVSVSALTFWTGCNSKPAENDAKTPATPSEEEHHEGDGHEHSGEHSHTGPHSGHLVELGKEEYHAEVVDDESSGKVTIYLLDGEAKNPVPIEQQELTLNLAVGGAPKQYTLAATPLDGEGSGRSSRFEATDKELLDAMHDEKATGRLNVTINGKPYVGTIEHHEHKE